MKIYTKKGDKGQTSLASGRRVGKTDPLIEAYGTVDELNSFIGDLMNEVNDMSLYNQLLLIQNKLFNVGSILAKDNADYKDYPTLSESDIILLESHIDNMNEVLPKMTAFILPGGSKAISKAHICRTVCRRAERRSIDIAESLDSSIIIKFLNRLSDYFFVFARYLHYQADIEEVKWDKDISV